MPHSYLKFEGVNGGKNGGPTTIDICYASAEESKVRLTVNDVDYSFLNTLSTGGWNQYTGHSSLTVPLGSGTTNTIILQGGYGGVNVDFLTLTPLQE